MTWATTPKRSLRRGERSDRTAAFLPVNPLTTRFEIVEERFLMT